MKKKKLGSKHGCFQCGCKFYDLKRSKPVCPKCGVEQTETKKKTSGKNVKQAVLEASPPVSVSSDRSRKRKRKDDSWEENDDMYDDDTGGKEKKETLEDGLTLVEEEDMP